jgi:hypothetical protein
MLHFTLHGLVQPPVQDLDVVEVPRDVEKLGRNRLKLTDAYAAMLRRVLQDLETYFSWQSDSIINYAEARRSAEPISTATTESVVQRLVQRKRRGGGIRPRRVIACYAAAA